MKKQLLFLLLLLPAIHYSQNITIPDANFKAILVANYDTDNDNEISTTEAANVTGSINAIGASISDITGIEHFINISGLNVENNSITNIDLSINTQLTTIDIDNNNISLIDLSTLTSLQFLFADNNPFYYIDLSNNPNLFSVTARNSSTITGINLDNGNASGIFQVDVTNNSNLTCIQVDAATEANPPAGWLKDISASYATSCPDFCYVNIPDSVFKNALLTTVTNNNGVPVNTNGDNEIQCNEAANITDTIDLVNLGITDLTGIEAFTGISRLGLWNDQISGTVDLTQNTNLQYVFVNNTDISNLIFSTITVYVDIENNDNLTTIDFSNSVNLISAEINNNNVFTTVDFSQSPNMTFINISDSSISSLNLGTKNSLDGILANRTSLSGNFDFSTYPSLRNVQMIGHANSNITGLSVANGNNTNFVALNVTGNPNLLCVEVDDANLVTNASWSQEDANTTYNEDCDAFLCWVTIPDANFKSELVNNSSINTNGDNEIQCAEAEAYTGSISVGGKNISDMTGIESFINITELICFGNQITSLDVSANVNLTSLLCNVNSLTTLNVANGNNTNFINFNATSNPYLSCILVDNTAYSDANWTNKDAGAIFSENCSSLSTQDFSEIQGFIIYPNPTSTNLFVTSNESIEKVEIYNYLGQKVLVTKQKKINTHTINKGVYILKAFTKNGKIGVKRFIKE